MGCDVGDAAFDGRWYRTSGPQIDHRVQRLTRRALNGRRRALWSWVLMVQSSLQVLVPGLTAVLLLETQWHTPEKRKNRNVQEPTCDVIRSTNQKAGNIKPLHVGLVYFFVLSSVYLIKLSLLLWTDWFTTVSVCLSCTPVSCYHGDEVFRWIHLWKTK